MKIKLVLILASSIVILSCGSSNNSYSAETNETAVNPMDIDTIQPFTDSLTYGVTGIDQPDAYQPEVWSKIFGSFMANQFKRQGLSFLDPGVFVNDFKKYRTNDKIDLPIEEVNSRLGALADSTSRFQFMNTTQKEEGNYLFAQVFYSDFSKSPYYEQLVKDIFEEYFLKSWNENLAPSENEMKSFEQYSRETTEKINAEKFMKVREDGEKFLVSNSKKAGVKVTASGLQYKVLKEGSGSKPTTSNEVEVHYEGKLINGNIFDSSYPRGETISFPLTRVIKGWTEGLQLMSLGSTYELYIPYDLAYGTNGSPPKIPPYSALVFKVELIAIK
jgi:FKBP-type peptidyl-prolyl cis-trans isomerase